MPIPRRVARRSPASLTLSTSSLSSPRSTIPRIAELGYQPGPLELVDEFGSVVGYMPPGRPFMTPAEFEAFEATQGGESAG